jgi:hypothetical protein
MNMGFFSWNCAKTKEPVLADVGGWPECAEHNHEVTVVYKSGRVISGAYDGYGRVGDVDIRDDMGDFSWCEPKDLCRLVLTMYYDGEDYKDLPHNEMQSEQGYFWDNPDLEKTIKRIRAECPPNYIRGN